MTLELKQSARREQGASRWHWEVWLTGTPDELGSVREVEYRLHPTFPDPVRTIKKRPDFRLKANGWGEFELGALVRFHQGQPRPMDHWVRLVEDDPSTPTPAIGTPQSHSLEAIPTFGADVFDVVGATNEPGPSELAERSQKVFVSYSAADTPVALRLRDELAANNIQMVTMDDTITVGSNWRTALDAQFKAADGMVVIVSDQASPWLQRDIQAFSSRSKPVIPLLVYGPNSIATPESIHSFKGVPISGFGNLSGVGAAVLKRLKAVE